MTSRVSFFAEFVSVFVHHAYQLREVILALMSSIFLGGLLMAVIENLSFGDGIYFAFITALSIGYGDIYPTTLAGKALAVAIGFVGIFHVGITVAIANRALAEVVRKELIDKNN